MRHAHAGSRQTWAGDDADRPLSAKGGRQAVAISTHLRDEKVHRVLSSRALRCVQTVTPLAFDHGLAVEVVPQLFEGVTAADALDLVRAITADGHSAVLCSHGDVIPAVIDVLGRAGTPTNGAGPTLPKGAFYTLTVEDGGIVGAALSDPRP